MSTNNNTCTDKTKISKISRVSIIQNKNYITCPKCLTTFKTKINSVNNNYKCICCHTLFNLNNIDNYNTDTNNINTNNNLNLNNKLNTKDNISVATLHQQIREQQNISDKLPININNNKTNKSKADRYIKFYKLKSKIILLFWLTVPLLILLGISTTIFEYKEQIAQNYKWREYIVKYCDVLNCKIPVFNNKDYIIIEDNAVVYNNDENQVKIYAILNNIGKFNQIFPALDIKFKDINGNILKHNIVNPEYYLENKNHNLLLKHSKQYINIILDNPGSDATNYEINLVKN